MSNNISSESTIESGVFISEDSVLLGKCYICSGSVIKSSTLENVIVGKSCKVLNSYISDCCIEENTSVGPFAHLRENSKIGKNCRIGNFVEIKNSKLGDRTKASHLTYIGDSEIGCDCNIGAGVVFANYNGLHKNKISVGNKVFIGCNSTLISPLEIKSESFIAGGSTVCENVPERSLCLARSKQICKNGYYNLYLENFKRAKLFFGTDGIRGVFGEDMTPELAKKVGNALCQLKDAPKILIGRDTRKSGGQLEKAFISGAMMGGGIIYNAGIVPTPCVSYLTKQLGCDFGVMLTASHNPKEYNGIKIFDALGVKLTDKQEVKVESKLQSTLKSTNYGKSISVASEVASYEKFLKSACKTSLKGIKIVLDCAGGASKFLAPKLFAETGAEVFLTGITGNINENTGCTHLENLEKEMKKHSADLGFAFDGDADRVLVLDKNLKLIDGDKIIYLLALWKKNCGISIKEIVGTIITNSKIEELLNEENINLKRTAVGDKYIIDTMLAEGQMIGGEQAGHIILGDQHVTGDGILTALSLCEIYAKERDFFENTNFEVYPQEHTEILLKNVKAKNLLKNEKVKKAIASFENSARIIVRPSGTEPKIRIMVESKTNAKIIANKLKNIIEKIIISDF